MSMPTNKEINVPYKTNTVEKYPYIVYAEIENKLKFLEGSIDELESSLPSTAFTDTNTVKKYIDDAIANVDVELAQRAICFETVADMTAATDLAADMICHTNGFHTSGDGGAAWYSITNSGTANGMDVIACGELYANLIVNNKINVECFGTHNDKNEDDYSIIQYAITNYPRFVVLNGTYYISQSLSIPSYGVVEGSGSIYSEDDCFTLDAPVHIKISGLRLYPQQHGIHITTNSGWANYNIFEDIFINGSYDASDSSKATISGIFLDRTTNYLNEQTFINVVCLNFAYGFNLSNPDTTKEMSMHRFVNCYSELSKVAGQYLKNANSIIFENCRHEESISNKFITEGICNHLIVIGGRFDYSANRTTMSATTNGIVLGSCITAGVYNTDTGQIAYIVNGKVNMIYDNVYSYKKQLSGGANTFPDSDNYVFKNFSANASSDMSLELSTDYYGGNGKINDLYFRIPANGHNLTITHNSKTYTCNATTNEQFIHAVYCNIYYSPQWFFIPMKTALP